MIVPFGVLLAVVPLPWLLTGHFDDFWYANVTFNMRYSSSVEVYERPVAALRLVIASLGSLPLVVLVWFGVFRSTVAEARRWSWVLAGGVAGILATGMSLNYYLTALFPLAALVGAYGWVALQERAPGANRAARWVLAGALVIACMRILPIYGAGGPYETHTAKFGYGRDVVAYELTDWVRPERGAGGRGAGDWRSGACLRAYGARAPVAGAAYTVSRVRPGAGGRSYRAVSGDDAGDCRGAGGVRARGAQFRRLRRLWTRTMTSSPSSSMRGRGGTRFSGAEGKGRGPSP